MSSNKVGLQWITADLLNDPVNNPFNKRPQGRPEITYKTAKNRDLLLVIDVREGRNNDLIAKIENRMRMLCYDPEEKIKREALDLFDFQFVFKNDPSKNFGPCFERKRADDLAASIKDGRYAEQKARMQSLEGVPTSNKVYIYEGNLVARNYGIEPKALLGASLLPPMRKEAEIQLTQNLEATADIIVYWLAYLEHLDDDKLVSQYSYSKSIHSGVRKRDFVEKNMLAIFLSQGVYGISGAAADAIAQCYDNSIVNLQMEYCKHPKETLAELANITYKVNGHDSKIGQASAANVVNACEGDKMRKQLRLYSNNNNNNNNNNDDDFDYATASVAARIKRSKKQSAAAAAKKAKDEAPKSKGRVKGRDDDVDSDGDDSHKKDKEYDMIDDIEDDDLVDIMNKY